MKVGYKRVSSLLQNTSRQLVGIEGIERIFEDKSSGKNIEGRQQLKEMIDFVRKGDVIVVHSMDRLGRNLKDLLMIVEQITSKEVTIQFVKENISLSGVNDQTPINKLLLGVMGSIAEFERELILERQKEGIELAKRRGIYKGRKPIDLEKVRQVYSLVHNEHQSVQLACTSIGISSSTYYKYVKNVV